MTRPGEDGVTDEQRREARARARRDPGVRRTSVYMAVLVVLASGLGLTVCKWAAGTALGASRPGWLDFVTSWVPLTLGIMAGLWLHHRALARATRRELFRMGVRVCPECGYPLVEGPPGRMSCPECGFVSLPRWHQ